MTQQRSSAATHVRTWSRQAARVIADTVDPFRLIGQLPYTPPPTTMLCVYRARNAATVRRVIEQMRSMDVDVALWALDDEVADLAQWTIGQGPGTRFLLLNRLAADVPPDRWLLVCDDDVKFGRSGPAPFLALAMRLGLQLCQPALARRRSYWSHPITLRQPLRTARRTTFVEIGPVLAIAPDARRLIVPFQDVGMGWGTELRWYDLQQGGLALGIIDVTPIRHLARAGKSYDTILEQTRQQAMFDARGITKWKDIQRNVSSLYRV